MCLAGTRTEVIDAVLRWAIGSDQARGEVKLQGNADSRVLWMCGQSGAGKSTVWRSLASHIGALGRPTTQYAFRANTDAHNPSYLFSTISRKLSRRHPAYKSRLLECICHPGDIEPETKNCAEQFELLIIRPFTNLPAIGETFLLIDAFDESAGRDLRNWNRQQALKVLTTEAHVIPAGLRIIVTSRPDCDVLEAIRPTDGRPPPKGVDLLFLDDDSVPSHLTQYDIRAYVKRELSEVVGLSLGEDGAEAEELSRKAGTSFQWASTACKYIQGSRAGEDPMPRLAAILKTGADLDTLYKTVLSAHFDDEGGSNKGNLLHFHSVLGRVVVAQEPMSFDDLSSLVPIPLSLKERELQRGVIRHLGSLLSGTHDASTPMVPLHPSFREYLQDAKNIPYTIDTEHSHTQMALGCLAVMKTNLRFNIYQVPSSLSRNHDLSNFQDHMRHVSPLLSYSCRFWALHASCLSAETWSKHPTLSREVVDFFNFRFLWWLEVMSATETSPQDVLGAFNKFVSNTIFNILSCALTFYLVQIGTNVLAPKASSLLRDAQRFASIFAVPITHSIPHIYLSALAFAPESSVLFETYSSLYPRKALISQGQLKTWPSLVHVMKGHAAGQAILSTTCWPDNTLVSAARDGGVYLWNMKTGERLRRLALGGGVRRISSIVFSTDGWRIAFNDSFRLSLWDARSGTEICSKWLGLKTYITALAFSSDGARLVSGSSGGGMYRSGMHAHSNASSLSPQTFCRQSRTLNHGCILLPFLLTGDRLRPPSLT